MDSLILYDTLYCLAAADDREERLFGTCAPLARMAFSRSLIGSLFPLVWFELPLQDKPRFDLHVAHPRQAFRPGMAFSPDEASGFDELFRWYSNEEKGGGGLAFAYDVSEGHIDAPALHVNVNNAPLWDMDRFFDLAAGAGAAELYQGFAGSLPLGWRIWYTGVHPGCPGSPIRVDCFVDQATKDSYARNVALLERDLRSCGFTALSPALRELARPILDSPFELELQFDVTRNGALGPTLGLSAGFGRHSPSTLRELSEDGGAIARLMGEVETLGLADDRWHHVPDATFGMIAPTTEGPIALYCTPTFVKLRLREGVPLDAKCYLEAGAKTMP